MTGDDRMSNYIDTIIQFAFIVFAFSIGKLVIPLIKRRKIE